MAYKEAAEARTTKHKPKKEEEALAKREEAHSKLHHLEVHKGENGGVLVVHHHMDGMTPSQHHVFGAKEAHAALAHIATHMALEPGEPESQAREEEGGEA